MWEKRVGERETLLRMVSEKPGEEVTDTVAVFDLRPVAEA